MQPITKIQPHSHDKRGDSTRFALIEAGLDLFGEFGFKGTTTRMLSDSAGANISAIPYYFGSKKGLYLAVMEYIVERMQEHFVDVRVVMEKMQRSGPISRDQALDAMKMMIQSIAQLFVESDEPKAWVQLIMREQARPTDAFDIIYEGQMKYVQKIFSSLIAVCVDVTPDSDEVKLRCHALMGQILIFILSRESLLRHLDVRKLTDEHIQLVYKILISHAEACLSIKLPDAGRTK